MVLASCNSGVRRDSTGQAIVNSIVMVIVSSTMWEELELLENMR